MDQRKLRWMSVSAGIALAVFWALLEIVLGTSYADEPINS
jgi:hypothetical protein